MVNVGTNLSMWEMKRTIKAVRWFDKNVDLLSSGDILNQKSMALKNSLRYLTLVGKVAFGDLGDEV